MKKIIASIASALIGYAASMAAAQPATPPAPPTEPTRIVIECEDMTGVNQKAFGFGKGWQVGRWGKDLYQNMNFGGVWASRLRTAMTDGSSPLPLSPVPLVYSDIEVPAAGTYKVWAKYECPPFFNYAFGISIRPLEANGKLGKVVFNKTYGLIDSPKHFSFNDKLIKGSLYWNWGIDHDAAEGYEVTLPKGRYRVTMSKTENPPPAGGRSVDTILITSDLSEISSPRMARYPLLDELRRANHVYFRFRNLSAQPAKISWNHWNHRYPDFYAPNYRELVKFYDASGKLLEGGKNGDWPDPIAAGGASVWYDLGPTMNVESTSPFTVQALPITAAATAPSLPLGVDIALAPSDKKIVKSFELGAGEEALTFLVQPDLFREEGVQYTKKLIDVYRDATQQLNAEPRLGPIPKQIKLFANTGSPSGSHGAGAGLDATQEFRLALGLNTFSSNIFDKATLDAIAQWRAAHGGMITRSLAQHHSTEVAAVAEQIKKAGIQDYYYYLSYGDEIGLPPVNVNDPAKVAAFQEFVKAEGETPQSLGLANWEQVKPLASLSADVAVQIGVLPAGAPATDANINKLKRLYWYSTRFRNHEGIADFAQKTREFKAALGPDVQTSANLGGMHPFFWMHQAAFIDSFKGGAMSLAWSEDYTYSQPEATRLVADFESAYLRKGASYHDNRTMYYLMPHWPGNSPERLIQNAVMQWGQNIKDFDFFDASPDAWSTENYVAYRGGMPTWKAMRQISGMAGLLEDDLLPARTELAPVAMLLSEASDVWEVEGKGQGAVNPGTVATNISQEERKNIWYALRLAGFRVDLVTEDDVKEGLLKNYKVLYVCGQNLERKAGDVIKQWVTDGGILYATAGAARKDEFDEPATAFDELLGRGAQKSYTRYRGPMRAKLELLFEKPLDRVRLENDGRFVNAFDVLASKETFTPTATAQVLARYDSDKSPAWVKQTTGKGMAYYIGALPAQAFIRKGLPLLPAGKGGDKGTVNHFEPVNFDAVAGDVILRPFQENHLLPDVIVAHRSVVANRLSGPASTVLPLVNLAEDHDGELKQLSITVGGITKAPQRVWSCFYPKGVPFTHNGDQLTITLPSLKSADVIVITR